MKLRRIDFKILRTVRNLATCLVFLSGLCVLSGLPAYAQNKTACELLSKADAEAILGVTLEPPQPSEPFRSLLDPDFTSGTADQGCRFTNFTFNYATPNRPKPPKVVNVRLEVRYSSTPNAHAVDEARKQVDTRTYDHPTDLPGLGDAAFWIGAPNNVTLFVFLGGTTRLMIGPSEIGLEQEKAMAARALAALGKTSFTYGAQPTGLNKPVLGKPGANASGIEQLKRDLTAKADAGDVRAQRTLGLLYQYSTLAPDGSAQPDYPAAAYWYHKASDHGDAQAAYELAILYHDGLGVTADASRSFHLLQKAAEANYVLAMPLLSDVYADQKTPVSGNRATYWATKAADAGDPRGWLALGFEYNMGKLGGDPPYWHLKAMEAYKKAAAGGNCVAMQAIADMYTKGSGVPADTAQAQSWQAKAQSCQGGNIAMLQQQVAKYNARAAAARDPALYPVLAARPNLPNSPAQARNNRSPVDARSADRSGFSRSIVAGLVAAAVVAIAAALLVPNPPPGNANDCCEDQNFNAWHGLAETNRCNRVVSNGLNPGSFGC
ncbi:MAG: sel1 repeat family protein [Acidipila sp.]|nr:sel1 repeat family protein [Acidipila sp.]